MVIHCHGLDRLQLERNSILIIGKEFHLNDIANVTEIDINI